MIYLLCNETISQQSIGESLILIKMSTRSMHMSKKEPVTISLDRPADKGDDPNGQQIY